MYSIGINDNNLMIIIIIIIKIIINCLCIYTLAIQPKGHCKVSTNKMRKLKSAQEGKKKKNKAKFVVSANAPAIAWREENMYTYINIEKIKVLILKKIPLQNII
jgi:hypothetical protein